MPADADDAAKANGSAAPQTGSDAEEGGSEPEWPDPSVPAPPTSPIPTPPRTLSAPLVESTAVAQFFLLGSVLAQENERLRIENASLFHRVKAAQRGNGHATKNGGNGNGDGADKAAVDAELAKLRAAVQEERSRAERLEKDLAELHDQYAQVKLQHDQLLESAREMANGGGGNGDGSEGKDGQADENATEEVPAWPTEEARESDSTSAEPATPPAPTPAPTTPTTDPAFLAAHEKLKSDHAELHSSYDMLKLAYDELKESMPNPFAPGSADGSGGGEGEGKIHAANGASTRKEGTAVASEELDKARSDLAAARQEIETLKSDLEAARTFMEAQASQDGGGDDASQGSGSGSGSDAEVKDATPAASAGDKPSKSKSGDKPTKSKSGEKALKARVAGLESQVAKLSFEKAALEAKLAQVTDTSTSTISPDPSTTPTTDASLHRLLAQERSRREALAAAVKREVAWRVAREEEDARERKRKWEEEDRKRNFVRRWLYPRAKI